MSRLISFELPMGYVDSNGNVHKECTIRRMIGLDEELISDRKVAKNPATAITELLSAVTVKIGDLEKPGRSVIRSLCSGDRDRMLLELRIASLGEVLKVGMKCENLSDMGYEIDVDFTKLDNISWGNKVSDAEMEMLEKEDRADEGLNVNHTGEIGMIEFELIDGVEKVTNDGTIVCKRGTLKLPDGIVEEQIAQQAMSNPAKANTILLAMCMKDLEGHALVSQKITQYMTRRDREYLTNLIRDNKVGPSLQTLVNCPICGEVHTFRMEFSHFFSNNTKA